MVIIVTTTVIIIINNNHNSNICRCLEVKNIYIHMEHSGKLTWFSWAEIYCACVCVWGEGKDREGGEDG